MLPSKDQSKNLSMLFRNLLKILMNNSKTLRQISLDVLMNITPLSSPSNRISVMLNRMLHVWMTLSTISFTQEEDKSRKIWLKSKTILDSIDRLSLKTHSSVNKITKPMNYKFLITTPLLNQSMRHYPSLRPLPTHPSFKSRSSRAPSERSQRNNGTKSSKAQWSKHLFNLLSTKTSQTKTSLNRSLMP
jgi:hypothetical protein